MCSEWLFLPDLYEKMKDQAFSFLNCCLILLGTRSSWIADELNRNSTITSQLDVLWCTQIETRRIDHILLSYMRTLLDITQESLSTNCQATGGGLIWVAQNAYKIAIHEWAKDSLHQVLRGNVSLRKVAKHRSLYECISITFLRWPHSYPLKNVRNLSGAYILY